MGYKINITVLVAPLDWGLGHATRCIPIIRYLLQKNCKVLLAAEGAQAKLLQAEFPSLEILSLPGYRITYASSRQRFAFKILKQLPKVQKAISEEHRWLRTMVDQHQVDAVISDNRYGLYHPAVKSIIITHQLRVKAPFGWAEKIIQAQLYKYIQKFSECWVPDSQGEMNLAGKLSHPKKLPTTPVTYIGPLSRMERVNSQRKYELVVLLSGPEPQRTILEKKIVQQLQTVSIPVLMVRGLPDASGQLTLPANVEQVNHLAAHALEKALASASLVIARSGYSTVMDLCKLGKKAILIPTPGQTEQEYLAAHLHKQQWCLYYQQDSFHLQAALKDAVNFPFREINLDMHQYHHAIDRLIDTLQTDASPSTATFARK